MIRARGEEVDAEVEVEILALEEWDPRGDYKGVLEAVREAVGGEEVRCFRVEDLGGKSVVYYYLLGLKLGGERRLVGVRVLSVES